MPRARTEASTHEDSGDAKAETPMESQYQNVLVLVLGEDSHRIHEEISSGTGISLSVGGVDQLTLEERLLEEEETRSGIELMTLRLNLQKLELALRSKNAVHVNLVESLHKELMDIVEKKTAAAKKKATPEGQEPDSDKKFDSDQDSIREYMKKNEERNKNLHAKDIQSKSVSNKSKKLFKKIAAKTHPDKTKDLRLHELFIRAKICLQEDDYDGLVLIWDAARTSGAKALIGRLLTRLNELRARVAGIQSEIQGIKKSDPYRMFIDYQNPACVPGVEAHFLRMLANHIDSLRKAIHEVDPERYPPVKTPTVPIFSTIFSAKIYRNF